MKRYNRTFSEEFMELIGLLLAYNCNKRLTVKEIMNHRWVVGNNKSISEEEVRKKMRGRINENLVNLN